MTMSTWMTVALIVVPLYVCFVPMVLALCMAASDADDAEMEARYRERSEQAWPSVGEEDPLDRFARELLDSRAAHIN